EDEPGNKCLVAYLAVEGASAPTVEELRDLVGKTLPEFMVPAAFVTMEGFPLSPNGKVNRSALPAPEHIRPELQAAYVPPRTPTEEKLGAIWSQVLHLQQVGMHDNFFSL